MSVSGLCEICQQPDVEHGCDRCGQLVCERHWDRQLGVCVECAGQVGGRDGQDSTENLPDGVDTFRF